MKHIQLFEDFINETRSIEKIGMDRTRVINDMAKTVIDWKAAKQSGDKQAETSFLQKLKDLTAEKTGLEKELNTAIASKDRFIELVISENNTIYEGAMSDIDLLAKEAKNFKDFVKEFKKDYKHMDTGNQKELEAWLKSVYDAAKEDMDESRVTEGKKTSTLEVVYQGPIKKYRGDLFKARKEDNGTYTLFLDGLGRQIVEVPASDVRLIELNKRKQNETH